MSWRSEEPLYGSFRAYVGFWFHCSPNLGLWPLIKTGISWRAALRAIWLGEVISIGVMELAMNFIDYHFGGMTAASVFAPAFWMSLLLALPAGFLAAWPVNVWLLSRQIKKPCH